MQWDLGLQGLGLLAVMAIGLGAVAGLIAGGDARYRLRAAAVATAVCFGFGLFTSEVWFGWATEEDLQPNVGGLSVDEVLLSGVAMSVVLGVGLSYLRRHGHRLPPLSRHHPAH